MTTIELHHLSADVLGLDERARQVLATRPHPPSLPGMIVPDTPRAVPRWRGGLDGEDRAELQRALQEHLARFQPHVNVLESLRALTHPDAALVVAGQQPGFLGGPLYDVYKALTAIRLARALSGEWDAPVLPVFWNHADDHDIAEVHHLWIQNPSLDLRKVSLAGVSSGRRPLSSVTFERERSRLSAIEEVLRQDLPAGELGAAQGDSRARAIDLFLPRDGESFSNAFTRVMLELFGAHGLIVLEPDWIRESLSRRLATLVTSDVHAALDEGGRVLRAAGGEPVIDPAQAALLFRHEGGKRNALRRAEEDGFRFDGEAGSRTPSELAAEIVQDPGVWSAGALLRPLVQDATLPVVAYVGGWGELAYHAQLPPLRERAGVMRTAFVPRLSATLVDAATQGSLAKLGLDVEQILRARGDTTPEPHGEGDEDGGSEAAARLRALARETRERIQAERASVTRVERGLAGQLKKVAAQVETGLEKIATKLDRVVTNQRGGRGRHQRRVTNALFPRETPQERIHGVLPFVARYGTDWIDTLVEEIDPLPTEHLVVSFPGGES